MKNLQIKSNEREQRLIAMGEMAATLAHEIRNPLGSMELYCSLLKKDLHTEPTLLNLAEQIHQGIRTLNNIINNSLQFSREITPKIKTIPDLAEYLNSIVSLVQDKLNKYNVKLDIVCNKDMAIKTDPYLLKQALINIVQNAIEAVGENDTQDKAVKIYCEIFEDKLLRIKIEDNGPGISEESMTKIFDPFFTTKIGGTGLGLPVALSIIKSLNGILQIESNSGVGTNIIVEINSFDGVCNAR